MCLVVDTAFNQIRQYARSNPAVQIGGLGAIAQDSAHLQGTRDAASLQRHARMIIKEAREAVPEAGDLADVETAFTAATHAVRALPD